MQLEIIHNDFKPSIIFPNSNYISATQIVEWSQRHRTLTSILREHDIVPFYFPINLFRPSTQPHLQPFLCHALELSSTMTVLVEGFYRPF